VNKIVSKDTGNLTIIQYFSGLFLKKGQLTLNFRSLTEAGT
jgi:hypothetical protein